MTNHGEKFSNRGGWSPAVLANLLKPNILEFKNYRTSTSSHPTQPPPTPH